MLDLFFVRCAVSDVGFNPKTKNEWQTTSVSDVEYDNIKNKYKLCEKCMILLHHFERAGVLDVRI